MQLADPVRLGVEPVLRPGCSLDDLLEHGDGRRLVFGRVVVELLTDRERLGHLALCLGNGVPERHDRLRSVLSFSEVGLLGGIADALVGRDQEGIGLAGEGRRVGWGSGAAGLALAGGGGLAGRSAPPTPEQEVRPTADERHADEPTDAEAAVPARGPATCATRSRGCRGRCGGRGCGHGAGGRRAESLDRRHDGRWVVALAQTRLERFRDDRIQLAVGDRVEPRCRKPDLVGAVIDGDEEQRVVSAKGVLGSRLACVIRGGPVAGRPNEQDPDFDALLVARRLDRRGDLRLTIGEEAGRVGHRATELEDVLAQCLRGDHGNQRECRQDSDDRGQPAMDRRV